MLEQLKMWGIQIAAKELGPSAIRAMILGASGWFIARENLLSGYGIISDAAARTTTIYWDKVSVALIAGLPAIIAVVIKFTQHTTTAVVTGAPVSGDPSLQARRVSDQAAKPPQEN